MRRDFTYVDDIVAGVIAGLDSRAAVTTASKRPGGSLSPHALYNIGNHQAVELQRLIEILEDALGRKAVTTMLPTAAGGLVETCADISAISRDLGFEPRTGIEEGDSSLRRLVQILPRDRLIGWRIAQTPLRSLSALHLVRNGSCSSPLWGE